MLAPNKQNLLLLKSQKKLVENGFKLLKEKRTGLIFTFLDLARQGKNLENQVSKDLEIVLKNYNQSLSFVTIEDLVKNLPNQPTTKIEIIKKRISGVYTDNLKISLVTPKRDNLKALVSKPLSLFASYFPILLEVSQLKINCTRISNEIKKVSRQISNLENKIQEIKEQIKFIDNALMEKTNLEKATLIKIFN
jgi:vacuolar-type H+-ATPase subunit D/Vma8